MVKCEPVNLSSANIPQYQALVGSVFRFTLRKIDSYHFDNFKK